MVPFDNIQFTGNYGNHDRDLLSDGNARGEERAKYYHITRQWNAANNITIARLSANRCWLAKKAAHCRLHFSSPPLWPRTS